jgi:hypothetical protein
MIIWSGHGILIPLLAIIGLVIGTVFGGLIGGEKAGPVLGFTIGGLLSTGLVWLYALTIGKTKETILLDPATGQQVRHRRSHTFFFIPAFAWAVLSSVGAVLLVVMGILAMMAGPSEPKNRPPGSAELSTAERLISGKSSGVLHGNTPEAKAMAETFSELAATMRGELIEKGDATKISLTGGEFLTYCQASDHGVAFLVHVPSLRKFSDDAKQVMCDAAWFAANHAVSGMNPPPKNLAVGVRGVILYESILLGIPAIASASEPTAGLQTRHKSHESDVLLPFFTPSDSATMAAQSATDQADTKSGSAPATSQTIEVVGRGELARGPADGGPKPEKTESKPETSAPQKPNLAGAPVLETNNPPTTPSTEDPSPAAGAAMPLPTEAMEWKSLDGRILKASLIRFTDAQGTSAEFKREDGQLFTIPLDRFAPESAAEMRKIHQSHSAR